jgi:Cof subfamily protein (haloacid dehalogenase superfamily)
MDIGWCVCDLDGTLLDSRGRLSVENISALKKLMSRGVEVILATGRTDLFVREFVDKLGIRQPVISCNGGLIRDVSTDEIIFIRKIGAEKSAKLADYCLQTQRDTLVYTTDQICFFRGSQKINSYNRYNAEVEAAFQILLHEIEQVEDLPLPEVLKFFISNINPEIAATIQLELNPDGELSMVQSMKDVLDIMAKDVSKGEALLFLAQKMGIDLARTVVFGDNHNDVSMLGLVGWPIAVANAEDDVKLLAKFIAPSNNDSGVAYAIQNYILEG